MEPIYGNHLGIVINDQDPEHRSRLQIFIPYLSNTLYASWNQDGVVSDKDINFKTFQDGIFKDSIKQKLKNILPWAEAAVPSFGGGTSGPVNTSLGKAVVDMAKGFLATGSVAGAALMTGATAIANQSTTPLYASKDGNNNDNNLSNGNYSNILNNALNQAQTNGYLTQIVNVTDNANDISADANGNLYSNTLEGFAGDPATGPMTYTDGSAIDGMKTPFVAVENSSDVGKWFAVKLNNNPPVLMLGVDPSTQGGNGTIIGPSSAGINNYHGEVSIAGLVAAGGGVTQKNSGLLSGTTLQKGDTLSIAPINDPSLPNFSITNKPTQDQLESILNSQLSDMQKNQLDYMVANAKNNEGQSLVAGNSSSGSKPVQRQFAATTIPPSTNAKGFYSKPVVGAKVWVFFYGGDIQRPVYFATAMEANGSIVAYQPITT